jgi:hypothetical protein
MSVTVTTHSLSALHPIRFAYNYNTKEVLAGKYEHVYRNWSYYKHDALIGFKDAVFSKNECVMLTDIKSLNTALATETTTFKVGDISGTLYLKSDNKYVTILNGNLFLGSPCGRQTTNALINIFPIGNSMVELKIGKKTIQIDDTYPYTARLLDVALDDNSPYRKFEMEFDSGLVSFKVKTPEGYRFLSYGKDGVIRAIGVELNETKVNNYHFEAAFKTRSNITYGFSPATDEVAYYNELDNYENKFNVNLKRNVDRPTNLLITCPTSQLSKDEEADVNISLLKTNYSSSGGFLPTAV